MSFDTIMENEKLKFKKEFQSRIYVFILRLIRFINGLPKNSVTNVMSKQLLRSGSSIGANYVEAQASSSKKDFINFFHYALKSANESKFWLALIKDSGNGNSEEADRLLKELGEISNILGSSILTMKGKTR